MSQEENDKVLEENKVLMTRYVCGLSRIQLLVAVISMLFIGCVVMYFQSYCVVSVFQLVPTLTCSV